MTLSLRIRLIISFAIGWYMGGRRREWGLSLPVTFLIVTLVTVAMNVLIILLIGA